MSARGATTRNPAATRQHLARVVGNEAAAYLLFLDASNKSDIFAPLDLSANLAPAHPAPATTGGAS